MIVRLKLFAGAKDLVGRDELEMQLPDSACVADLRAALIEMHPALTEMSPHLMIAVDAQYANDKTPIPAGAEVACIPPVSGG